MSQAIKDWIEDQREHICEDYAAGALDFEEAMTEMRKLGFDPHEAQTILQEYVL